MSRWAGVMGGIVARSPAFRLARSWYLARNPEAQQPGDLILGEPEPGQDRPALAAEGGGGRGRRKTVAVQPQRRRQHSYGPDRGMRQVVDEAVGQRLRIVKNLDGELHAGSRDPPRVEDRLPLGGGARGQDSLGLPPQRLVVPVGGLTLGQPPAVRGGLD